VHCGQRLIEGRNSAYPRDEGRPGCQARWIDVSWCEAYLRML
jgi:hypothetical protein